MANTNKKELKDILADSSHLFGVFGILNAFLIFGLELSESEIMKDIVLPWVFLLSIIVFNEIITINSNIKLNSIKISLYFISLLFIQIGLVIYFIEFYQPWAKILFLLFFWLGLFYKSSNFLLYHSIKISRRYKLKIFTSQVFISIIVILTLIMPIFILLFFDMIFDLNLF